MPKGSGGGRPKKPENVRRNRNAPTRHEIVISTESRVEVVPEPAFELKGIRTELWDRLWAQPIAMLWSEADVGSLTRLVVLQTTADAFNDRGLLAEMRQLEDRFLLNPYARAQQRVKLATIEDEGEEAASVSDISAWRERIDGTG